MRKIYDLTSREYNDKGEVIRFKTMIVIANSEDEARLIHLGDECDGPSGWENPYYKGSWAKSPEDVKVEYVGLCDDNYKPYDNIITYDFPDNFQPRRW
jgi:hypothetical protein